MNRFFAILGAAMMAGCVHSTDRCPSSAQVGRSSIKPPTVDEEEARARSGPLFFDTQNGATMEVGEEDLRAGSSPILVRPSEASIITSKTYPYVSGTSYRVLAAPGYVTDVILEPGEALVSPIAAGDSERWEFHIGNEVIEGLHHKHVYIRPLQSGLKSNAVLATNRRTYLIDLESQDDAFVGAVNWTYTTDGEDSSHGQQRPSIREDY